MSAALAGLWNRYLAYQRDIGIDEVILAQPLALKPLPAKAPLHREEDYNPASYLRDIADSLSQGKPVNPAPVPRPNESVQVSPSPLGAAELSYSNLSAFRSALANAALPLHPLPAGKAKSPMIWGRGEPGAMIAVVALQPYPEAQPETGPFAGEPGELLGRMLKAIKVDVAGIYATSLMKVAHPGRGWARKDTIKMLPWLAEEMRLARPQIILALGEEMAQILLRAGLGYEAMRQKSHAFAGLEMAMTLDPPRLLAQEELKRDAWKDLQWVMQRLREKEEAN